MLSFNQVLDMPSPKRRDVIRQAMTILQKSPQNTEAMVLASAAFVGERDSHNARNMLETAHKIKPKDPVILHLLARFYKETNDHKKAKIAAGLLCDLDGKNAENWLLRGQIYEASGEMAEAIKAYSKCTDLGIPASAIDSLIGDCYRYMGEMTKAIEAFEKSLAVDQYNSRSLYGLANTGKFDKARADDLVARIDAALERPENQHKANYANLCFAAAKVLSDAGDTDGAFKYYGMGNDCMRPEEPESDDPVPIFLKEFANNKRAYNSALIKNRAGFGSPSKRPIFVIGMPRSGTTLVESICASHSKVVAADELPFLEILASQLGSITATPEQYQRNIAGMQNSDVMRFAKSYLEHSSEIVGPSTRFTDKLPHNFMQVGLINLLFPNAKIVHCRRHPIDNCLSLYTNSMNQVHNFYKTDLSRLGRYYREYDGLMAHWHAIYPGKIHDVYYEDVVVNTELNARNLMTFLELDWEDSVLERQGSQKSVRTLSAWQVRQPVYKTSAGKWRVFEKHLGPLIEALDDVTEKYEKSLTNAEKFMTSA